MFANRITELLEAERLDPPLVGILANGTSGDINNIDFTGATKRESAPYAQMQRVADVVAAEVYKQIKTVEYKNWVPLKMRHSELKLGLRHPTRAQFERAKSVLDQPENSDSFSRRERSYARRILQITEDPSTISTVVQTIRIGDLGIAGALLIGWVNGAVGIIGSEDNPANLLYGAVFAVGLVGSLVSRFKPRGMACTLFAAAIVQMLVPVAALIISPEVSWGNAGVVGVFIFNSFFAVLLVVSALLFLRAGTTGIGIPFRSPELPGQ